MVTALPAPARIRPSVTSRFPTRCLSQTGPDETILVGLIIAASTLARLVFAFGIDYGIDEAYAVAIGRHPDWSYFDHPPLTFWIISLFETLFGSHAAHGLMRLPFVLAFSATLWLMFLTTRTLLGARAGVWTVALLATAPFFFASAGSWLVPDGPLDLFLAATAAILARILADRLTPEEIAEHWLFAGVTFGLACLSKYHAVVFGAGAVAYLLLTPHRRLLATPAPWIAGLIALAILSPVVWWNAHHGWISFAFQSGRASGGGGLHPDHLGQMLAGAAAYLMPWTLGLCLWAAARAACGRPAWLDGERARQGAGFLLWLGLPMVVIFTLAPLFGGRGLPHWPMPGWLFLVPLAGALLAGAAEEAARWPRRLVGLSAGLIGVLAVSLMALLQSADVARRVLDWPGLVDGPAVLSPLIREATDWTDLPAALRERGVALDGSTFVVALRWTEASRIAAALGPRVPVVVFNPDARGFAFATDQRDLLGRDAVIIGDWRPRLFLDDAMKPYFTRIDRPQLLTITVAGGLPRTLDLAVAHGFTTVYPLPYGRTGP